MIFCTCMRCRACGCSPSPSPSTGVRPRPSRRSKEALVSGTSGSFPIHTLRQTYDKVVLGARDQAIPLHHTGNQRSVHDAAGTEGKGRGQAVVPCDSQSLPNAPPWWKATIGWSGRSPMSFALTADLSNAVCFVQGIRVSPTFTFCCGGDVFSFFFGPSATSLFCFGDDSHRRDARHSHPCEDRRDAETAH